MRTYEMPATASYLSFEQRAVFESRVFRAVIGGAAAGVAHLVLATMGAAFPLPVTLVPFPEPQGTSLVSFFGFSLAGAAIAAWPGSMRARLFGALTVVAAVILPGLLGVHPLWRLGLAAMTIGAFFLHAFNQAQDSAWSSQRPEGWGRRLASGLAVALMTTAGARVALLLGVSADSAAMPGLFVAALGGGVLGLFIGLGTGVAHLAPPLDPIEAELEAVLPKLNGELAEAARRALERYRQCAKVLAQLPAEPGREELAQTLSRATRDVAKLADEWAGLEALLAEVRTEALEEQIQALRTRASAASDPLARRQLEAAAAALQEGRERAQLLSDQRQRVHAKLHSSVALLECARLALLGTRGGETQLKVAQLAGVSERLKALVSAQGEDARWVDALATGAEIAAVESRNQVS